MLVVGVAFRDTHAASRAEQALARFPGVRPDTIAHAPLGAVGRRSRGEVVVAVCVKQESLPDVKRLVTQLAGHVVTQAPCEEPAHGDHVVSYPVGDESNGAEGREPPLSASGGSPDPPNWSQGPASAP